MINRSLKMNKVNKLNKKTSVAIILWIFFEHYNVMLGGTKLLVVIFLKNLLLRSKSDRMWPKSQDNFNEISKDIFEKSSTQCFFFLIHFKIRGLYWWRHLLLLPITSHFCSRFSLIYPFLRDDWTGIDVYDSEIV
jgi:hypothetical protein